MRYKFFDHTADAKFQAYGKSLDEAFSNAAVAMFSAMLDTEKVKPKMHEEISVEGKDNKQLLYSFLEELLFLLDTKGFVLHDVMELNISGDKLTATLAGDTADKYEIAGDVKAVTYNEMEITEKDGEFIVQVVVDM